MNIDGLWTETIVDDYFPIKDEGRGAVQFAFSRTSEDELWVLLLEKAYAKNYGNYFTIEGGDPVYALRDLTGAPFDRITDLKSGNRNEYWQQLTKADRREWIMCCYTGNTNVREEKMNTGIVSGHAYSLLQAQEVVDSQGRNARIVQIRNPWGKTEWNGPWSDNSNLWTPELRKKYNVVVSDDGVFWMSFDDFCQNYQGVGICKVEKDYFYCGEAITMKGGNDKSIVRFDIYNEGTYTLSLDQKDRRHFSASKNYTCSYFRVTVGKILGDQIEFVDCVMSSTRNIFVKEKIGPGKYVALIEAYWENNLTREFVFSIYGSSETGLENVGQDDATFKAAEYQIWKSHAQKNANLYKPSKGGNQQLQQSSFQDDEAGISINKWSNTSRSDALNYSFGTHDAVGFTVLSEQTQGNDHKMVINPNSHEAIIFKMDPRNEEFSSSLTTTDQSKQPGPVQKDTQAINKLNNFACQTHEVQQIKRKIHDILGGNSSVPIQNGGGQNQAGAGLPFMNALNNANSPNQSGNQYQTHQGGQYGVQQNDLFGNGGKNNNSYPPSNYGYTDGNQQGYGQHTGYNNQNQGQQGIIADPYNNHDYSQQRGGAGCLPEGCALI